ncbi:MAG: molybdopterin-dependent oxidoreductase [Deltaproteobacteria bacterium]|nr:molybdopterin-dependent oxidoreductase [Deltaproteobacteria bacterium]
MEINRRDFLKVLGATGASALAGCASEAPERLIPYLIPPEEVIPGQALWYASTCRECPAGCGVLVKVREGRAIKVEGNPEHPVNRGKLCARGQASPQGLYNPDRVRQPLRRDASGKLQPISWDDAEKFLAESLDAVRGRGLARQIALVTPLLTGSLDRLIADWLKALGSQRHLRYEPFAYEPLRAASKICFDRDTVPSYRLGESKLILSFGADFLESWISPVEFAREFSKSRSPRDGEMGRFIYVGPRYSLTAANADEWVSVRPGTELFLALGMIHVIVEQGLAASAPQDLTAEIRTLVRAHDPKAVAARTGVAAEKIVRLARDFAAQKPAVALGGGIASSGSNAQATAVAIHLLDYLTGNMGRTVRFDTASSLGQLSSYGDLVSLVQSMARGEIQALFLHNVNPLFTLPQSVGFAQAMKKVPLVVSFSSFMDETAADAHLVLPDHTPLESWGDYSPREGVIGLMQPAMRPLFDTKGLGDLLISVAKKMEGEMAKRFPWASFYDYLRDQWKEIQRRFDPQKEFKDFWDEALQRGGVWKESRTEAVRLNGRAISSLRSQIQEANLTGDGDKPFYLSLYPSLSHFDGRGANRPWLQELPDPMTSIVWGNWLELHAETAKRLQLRDGDVVSVASPYGKIELPARLSETIRPDVVAIPIGQGHSNFGRFGSAVGANPIHLLSAGADPQSGALPWLSVKVMLAKTGRRQPLVSVAGSENQQGREIAQAISLAELREGEKTEEEEVKQIYAPHEHPKHRWGMAIDLNACTGCNACVVACYAENNLPVVGKEQVAKGREMSWIQIQRYVDEGRENPQSAIRNPKFIFLPMLCQQCDAAPCESVCPIYATYHTPDGLNAQVYNRCVGVRYCANNCPYKVRRFNWFEYDWPEPLNSQLNPDVTVRSVGIMEKCTFCVQRIREVENRAKAEGRKIKDGEIVPACAQTCPTEAIVFGDLKEPESRVAKLSHDPRRYRVLEHLNTQPAVTYLKKVKNG